jgi:hypothetical protein
MQIRRRDFRVDNKPMIALVIARKGRLCCEREAVMQLEEVQNE